MSISGSYNFDLTRNQIVTGALRLLGVISQGQTPDATQITDGSEALNVLIKAWQAEGLPLWAIKEMSFTPVADTTSYQIGTSLTVNTQEPLKIYQAWYRNTTSEMDIPLTSLVESQYNELSNKSQNGTPVSYFYKRGNGLGTLYLYQTPDTTFCASNTIYFSFQRPFSDFDSSTDTADFPQEWIRALKYGLADEIALEYGYPIKDRTELRERAEQYKQEALGFTQEEGSIFFSPDNMRRW